MVTTERKFHDFLLSMSIIFTRPVGTTGIHQNQFWISLLDFALYIFFVQLYPEIEPLNLH